MLYDAGRAVGIPGQLFVLSIIAIGWLVIINLFLSILLVRGSAGARARAS